MATAIEQDLKHWALANGKQVTLPDGTIFNSAKRKLSVQPRRKQEVPEPQPQPPAAQAQQPAGDPQMSALKEIVFKQAEQVAALTEQVRLLVEAHQVSLKKEPQQPTVAKVSPEEKSGGPVRFEITRNAEGFITSVVATPDGDAAPRDIGSTAVQIAKRAGR